MKTWNIPLRISMIYALAGCLWILFSDAVLYLVITDPIVLTRLQTFKGWLFFIITASLLYILVNRYVSAMKLSEQAMRESEKTLRILADSTASAIFIYGDKFITVNRATEQLTGYSEAELRSMNLYNGFSCAMERCQSNTRQLNGLIVRKLVTLRQRRSSRQKGI